MLPSAVVLSDFPTWYFSSPSKTRMCARASFGSSIDLFLRFERHDCRRHNQSISGWVGSGWVGLGRVGLVSQCRVGSGPVGSGPIRSVSQSVSVMPYLWHTSAN